VLRVVRVKARHVGELLLLDAHAALTDAEKLGGRGCVVARPAQRPDEVEVVPPVLLWLSRQLFHDRPEHRVVQVARHRPNDAMEVEISRVDEGRPGGDERGHADEVGGLQKLSAPMVNALYADMQLPEEGRQVLKPTTVRRVHATLHKSLSDAVRWQLVSRNVAAAADPPRASRPRTRVWTPEQLHRFLDLAADSPLYVLWLFYAFTGVRRGEALGLRWEDVDLVEGRAAITQAVVPVDHALVFSEPKTDKGRRAVDLDEMTVAALKKHRRQQLEQRMAMGSAYVDQDLVFARSDGSPIHPEYVSRTFSKLVGKLGLPAIRLHDLRHTHATLLLIAGVATRVVGDGLGHSATAVTSDLHQHVISDLGADAAARVADLCSSSVHGPLCGHLWERAERGAVADERCIVRLAGIHNPPSHVPWYSRRREGMAESRQRRVSEDPRWPHSRLRERRCSGGSDSQRAIHTHASTPTGCHGWPPIVRPGLALARLRR